MPKSIHPQSAVPAPPRRRSPHAVLLALLVATACACLPAKAATTAASSAEIHFQSDLDHIDLAVTPSAGGGGCVPGQQWDVGAGRCSVAVALRTATTTRNCACSCASGQTGSCTARQTGTYPVYGWRTPPAGVEVVSHNGATAWGACTRVSSTCAAAPPATPRPGEQFPIDRSFAALICSSSDTGWNSVTIAEQYKAQLVNYYKTMGVAGRCPDPSGFSYWLSQWTAMAGARALELFNAAGGGAGGADWSQILAAAYAEVWQNTLRYQIDASAATNDEQGAGGLAAANGWCQRTAAKLFGPGISASYIPKSGNRCRVI